MQIPLQVTFRHQDSSEELEAKIREEAAKLERYHPYIIGCKVTLDVPHHRHRRGNLFDVRIELTVRGDTIVVTREPAEHSEDESPLVVVREAFDSARRQLEDQLRRQRHQVKNHEVQPRE